MPVQTKEDKYMKFKKKVVYTTDGNTHNGANLEYKDALNIYMKKDDSVRRFNASNNVRFKATDIAFTELDSTGKNGYTPAELIVTKYKDDGKFRKPPKYEYIILPSKDILIYQCKEITFSYDMHYMESVYKIKNIYSVKEESRPLLDLVYGCGEVINIEEKELEQLMKEHYDSFFNYRHYVGYEELWNYQI